MDEVREGLKYLFQTNNKITFCGTGTGNSGIEIALGNLIEKNDVVLICVNGAFGIRAAEMAKRYGADVRTMEAKLGSVFTYEQISAHIDIHEPKILFICHGESSTGVLNPIEHLGTLCRR